MGAPVLGTYRVIYGDTDQMGVVYYANYLVFFERGRCDYMRAHAFDYVALEAQGFFLPVVDAAVKYLKPARFDDLLTIETTLEELGRSSLRFAYRVLRGDDVLSTGHTRHACVSREGRPVRLPTAVVALD